MEYVPFIWLYLVDGCGKCDLQWFIPIGSMYDIFTYIWLIFVVNVGKYTIVPWILSGIYIYIYLYSLSQWTLKKKSLNFIFPTVVIPKSLSRLAIGQVSINIPWWQVTTAGKFPETWGPKGQSPRSSTSHQQRWACGNALQIKASWMVKFWKYLGGRMGKPPGPWKNF